ncbi:MAG TPA: protein phosphatase 2C domain-containing protein [Intrasporangium sp.]|uniref:PP2C family protein-serine/threonine phosphatase n=1 Tax=Intrasporangium sp. TaxID=1925024 RepID=UPI002B45E2FF|nr:protein phosphatase 2C domain-containing protein [Intrasporangium sp.]HKX66109.1 protein phosphatase 2C domain-containing protein [Intrasporangium sp.]
MTDSPLPTSPAHPTVPGPTAACPVCGTPHAADASFCEACGADLAPRTAAPGASPAAYDPVLSPATPQTAPPGQESPLDVGWTGAVASGSMPTEPTQPTEPTEPTEQLCQACGQGRIVDGYCDHCGTPPPDPRNHYVEAPATWVGGVCDIGKRHARNEDAMALSATEARGSRAVLVVCDGVSMATDSHIASLAAARAARSVLDQPLPKGVGTPESWGPAAAKALTTAVATANDAVARAVDGEVQNPPSCTIAAAVIEDGVVVAGNVGDSRVYWLPDGSEPARQLGEDDSYAHEQMRAGVTREVAENGPHAHSITRWLGTDAPDDLAPHLTTLSATEAARGWLLVCSDGLWNYCSDAEDMRVLVHNMVEQVGHDVADSDPAGVAQALVDFANEQGGRDNITVALARLAGQGSQETTGAVVAAPEEGDPIDG